MKMCDVDHKMISDLLNEANITTMDWESSAWRKVDEASKRLGIKVRLHSGASKLCIDFPSKPYVVKFVYETSEYDEAMDEARLYEKARSKNLDKFFPFTEYWGTINEINFVVQEKITCSCYDTNYKQIERYKNIGKTVTDDLYHKIAKDMNKVTGFRREINPIWVKALVSLYGKKAIKALCEFIQENNINDLHEHNIGYHNDRPILLDFSGYHRN